MQSIRLLTGMMLVLAAIGCGRSTGPQLAKVSGKITLDGTPLDQGSINFIPTDGKGASSGAKIDRGTFVANVPPGDKRVEIRSAKVVGQRDAYAGDPKSPKIDIIKERIPMCYNGQSELKSVIAKGNNSVDFALESPKK